MLPCHLGSLSAMPRLHGSGRCRNPRMPHGRVWRKEQLEPSRERSEPKHLKSVRSEMQALAQHAACKRVSANSRSFRKAPSSRRFGPSLLR